MAFELMTQAELEELGLGSQEYPNLDKENGIFYNRFWKFEDEFISTDLLEFRRKYSNGSDIIYLISFNIVATGGKSFKKYEFYKEI